MAIIDPFLTSRSWSLYLTGLQKPAKTLTRSAARMNLVVIGRLLPLGHPV